MAVSLLSDSLDRGSPPRSDSPRHHSFSSSSKTFCLALSSKGLPKAGSYASLLKQPGQFLAHPHRNSETLKPVPFAMSALYILA